MLRIDRSSQNIFKGFTYQIRTPDGTMFVNVMEDHAGQLCAVDIKIGKAGLPLRAWAHCFGRLITMALEHGSTLSEITEELSSQTADKSITSINGTKVRSGPEGVYNALMMYKEQKYMEAKQEFHIDDNGNGRSVGRFNGNRRKA